MQNGRLKGEQKRALRAVIERYEIPVTLTANQNIILREVDPAWKDDITNTLEVGCCPARGASCAVCCGAARASADAVQRRGRAL